MRLPTSPRSSTVSWFSGGAADRPVAESAANAFMDARPVHGKPTVAGTLRIGHFSSYPDGKQAGGYCLAINAAYTHVGFSGQIRRGHSMAEPQLSVRSAKARDLAHRLARRERSTIADIVERALEAYEVREARHEPAASF
jgi:hypothetical protein